MKVSLTLDNFPMLLFEPFKEELAKYVEANVQVGGENTVFVSFATDDVVKAQEGVIVADKYHFAKGGELDDPVFHQDEG